MKVLEVGQRIKTRTGVETYWTFIVEMPPRIYGTHKKSKKRLLRCKCDCGTVKDVQFDNILSGSSLCCNKSTCRVVPNKGVRSEETSYNGLYDNYKRGAIRRGYSFDINMEEFKNFLSKNCFYCGKPPTQVYRILDSKTKEVRAGIPITYNGIDRKNNTIGYTTENSITCCKDCNIAKTNKNTKDFLNWIKSVYEHLNLKYYNG